MHSPPPTPYYETLSEEKQEEEEDDEEYEDAQINIYTRSLIFRLIVTPCEFLILSSYSKLVK